MDGPDFFMVGAPKCGTTAMHQFLRQHPQVFLPEQKELHFHGSDLASLPSTLTPDQHAALFRDTGGAARVGETCIWALYSTRAAREIRAARPDARIIVMLRHPIDVMHANHSEFLYQAIEDIGRFDRALAAERRRRRGRGIPWSSIPGALYLYRAVATFSEQVERYLDEFGPGRVHLVLHDDLRRDPAETYRGVLRFLEVDPSFTPDLKVINPNKRVRSVRLQHALYNPTTWGWKLLKRHCHRPTVGRLIGAAARWNVSLAPRGPMDPALRQRLEAEFTPEIERLGKLIGRDLPGLWLRHARAS